MATIGEVITLLKAAVPDIPEESPLDGSSDTLKAGDEGAEVTGVVTTFLATAEVIEKLPHYAQTLSLRTNRPFITTTTHPKRFLETRC